MTRSSQNANTSRSVILAIVIAAAAIWGLYVWKFRTEDNKRGEPIALTPGDVETVRMADKPLLPLRAERDDKQPIHSADPVADASSSRIVSDLPFEANRPVSLDDRPTARIDATISPTLASEDNTTSERTPSVDADVLAGRRALDRGQWLEARTRLSRALDGRLSMEQMEKIRNDLAQISERIVFGKTVIPGDTLTRQHEIASGESLYVLARRNKVTMDLLQTINEIERPEFIRAGQRLKIIDGPFDAVIRKSQHRMDIFLKGQYIRSFRVGLGTDGGTPVGKWEVTTKLINPEWTDPRDGQYYAPDNPNNPIGDYWVGLDCIAGECLGLSGYGIHGTIEPESIGADRSMGCVRLLPEDIKAVYQLLVPRHSTVDIVP